MHCTLNNLDRIFHNVLRLKFKKKPLGLLHMYAVISEMLDINVIRKINNKMTN